MWQLFSNCDTYIEKGRIAQMLKVFRFSLRLCWLYTWIPWWTRPPSHWIPVTSQYHSSFLSSNLVESTSVAFDLDYFSGCCFLTGSSSSISSSNKSLSISIASGFPLLGFRHFLPQNILWRPLVLSEITNRTSFLPNCCHFAALSFCSSFRDPIAQFVKHFRVAVHRHRW